MLAVGSSMRKAWLLVAASLALASGTAGASAPQTWTVVYSGQGTWSEHAEVSQQPVCSASQISDFHSTFHWTVTWHNVVLGPHASSGPPSGSLVGSVMETSSAPDPAHCSTIQHCSENVPFVANESSTSEQPAELQIILDGQSYDLHFDMRESAVGGGDGCSNYALNRDEMYFAIGAGMQVGHPFATIAKIPVAESRTMRKFIVNVQRNPFIDYPSSSTCDGPTFNGSTCTHSQNWTGTVTVTR